MNNDKNKNDTKSQGTVEEAAKASVKVKKTDKLNLSNKGAYFILGGLAFFIILIMLLSGHSSNKDTDSGRKGIANNQDYKLTLSENLDRLKKANQNIKAKLVSYQNDHVSEEDSHEYQMRQNAPTSMYTAAPITAPSASRNSSAVEATFAGNSAFDKFGNQNTGVSTATATRIEHPRYTIASGEFLHAVLETAINSDLPGMVRAVVSDPVYAYVGETPIIPAGSRLIGQYASAVFKGQNRVFVIWNRVILPNGISIQINSPGTDALGRAGIGADEVNTHFWGRFGQSILLSLIGAGASTMDVNSADQYNSASMYRAAIGQSFQQSAEKSLQDNDQAKATLNIYQGTSINVFVARDLSFYNVLRHDDRFMDKSGNRVYMG